MTGLVNSYEIIGGAEEVEIETKTESETYTYYPNGNKKSVVDMAGKLTQYTYDNAGRLTAETVDDAVTAYTYDGYNNRIGKTNGGVQTSYLYDNRNRLTRESFTKNGQTTVTSYQYDPNGNLYSKQTLTYGDNTIQTPEVSAVLMGYTAETNDMLLEYNNFNQLTTVTKGDSIFSYDYYANGLRKTKYEQSDHNYTTAYYWDGQNMVGEMFMDSLSIYLRGHRLIAVPAGEFTQYFHFNGHGDVTTTTDMYGVMCDYQYDAFGNVENPYDLDRQPIRYCGEYYDVETGFIYLRNRYYDPSMGRFISEDPIRDGLNWYAYCENNPVMFVDPTGLDAIVITNENSVPVGPLGSLGHTSAIYQNADGDWFYTYWGNKAAAVIHIPDKYTKWLRDGDVTAQSMSSLDDFNNTLNNFLWENGFENITSNYTHATYIVGDFTSSLKDSYGDVYNAYQKGDGTIKSLDDGSVVFQGKNKVYCAAFNNCFDRTYASLSKGTLKDGTNVGTYMNNLGFKGGTIPNDNTANFRSVFMNNSFTYNGAYASLMNYSNLYDYNSPYARKPAKAAYAKAVIKK